VFKIDGFLNTVNEKLKLIKIEASREINKQKDNSKVGNSSRLEVSSRLETTRNDHTASISSLPSIKAITK